MITIGGREISFITYGGKVLDKVYHGSILVWQRIKETLVKWWINERPWINEEPWVQ